MKGALLTCLIFLILPVFFTSAQVDSLRIVVMKSSDDTTLIHALYGIADHYKKINIDSAIYYYQLAVEKSLEGINNETQPSDRSQGSFSKLHAQYIQASIGKGNALFWQGNYKQALDAYTDALQEAIKTRDLSSEGECYGEMATVHRNLGDYQKAIDYNNLALSIADSLHDQYWEGILYNNRGVIYQAVGDYQNALESFFTSLKKYQDYPSASPHVELLNIGRVYELQKEYEKAMNYYSQSLAMSKQAKSPHRIAECLVVIGNIHLLKNKFDTARMYFQNALDTFQMYGFTYRTDVCYRQVAATYTGEERYLDATNFLNRALDIAIEKEDFNSIAQTYLALSEVSVKRGDEETAIDYAMQSYVTANQIHYLEIEQKASLNLAHNYEEIGDFPAALKYYKIHAAASDSLFGDEKFKSLSELEFKYQTEKKDLELTMIQKEKELVEERFQRNRTFNILLASFLFLSLISFVLFYYFMKQRAFLKANQLEREQMQLKHDFNQKLKELKFISLKNQLNPHFIFNALNSIGSTIIRDDRKKAYDLLTHFSDLIRISLDYSDQISKRLNDELDFVHHYLLLEKARFKDKFDYEIAVDPDVDKRVLIPRLSIQIFAENAVKHGLRHREANGKLFIHVKKNGNAIDVLILDNGVGRGNAKILPTAGTGKGLDIIQQMFAIFDQLHQVKTHFEIIDLFNENKEPSGTKIILQIPEIHEPRDH